MKFRFYRAIVAVPYIFIILAALTPDTLCNAAGTKSAKTGDLDRLALTSFIKASRSTDNSQRLPVNQVPEITYHNQTLTEDTTWRGEVLIEEGLVIASQTTLTIEPGTVVRFSRSTDTGDFPALLILGRCIAFGTAEKPILFTSRYAIPKPGDWQGVVVLASDKKNHFENCRFEGAEIGLEGLYSSLNIKNCNFENCRTGARFQDTVVVLSGGVTRDCETGIVIADSEGDFRDLAVSTNNRGIIASRSSVFLSGATITGSAQESVFLESSRIKIFATSITGNNNGLKLVNCEGAVSNNRMNRNTEYGMSLTHSRVKVSGNEVSGNDKFGVRTEDGMGVAWGNAIYANGLFDLYNAGDEDFRAFGNWWGVAQSQEVEKRIFDRRTEESKGRVLYLPLLTAKPPFGF